MWSYFPQRHSLHYSGADQKLVGGKVSINGRIQSFLLISDLLL